MDKALTLAAGCLLVCAQALAGSIYRCNTPEGVVFSQSPCAKDAVRLDREEPPADETLAPAADSADLVDISDPSVIGVATPDNIVAALGEPAARYTIDGTDHWFYPNAFNGDQAEPRFAEMLIEDGLMFQINWLPADMMTSSVAAARRFEGWMQPQQVVEKRFDAADTDLIGSNKSDVTARFGQPDAKKVHFGREWWEYRKVTLTSLPSQMLTIYFEFDGDKVIESVGN